MGKTGVMREHDERSRLEAGTFLVVCRVDGKQKRSSVAERNFSTSRGEGAV